MRTVAIVIAALLAIGTGPVVAQEEAAAAELALTWTDWARDERATAPDGITWLTPRFRPAQVAVCPAGTRVVGYERHPAPAVMGMDHELVVHVTERTGTCWQQVMPHEGTRPEAGEYSCQIRLLCGDVK